MPFSNNGELPKWESPEQYETEQSPLEDKEIESMARNLKRAGYEFALRENSDEYILEEAGFEGEMHFAKIDPYTVMEDNTPHKISILEVIKARIMNPREDLYEAILQSRNLQKREKSIQSTEGKEYGQRA